MLPRLPAQRPPRQSRPMDSIDNNQGTALAEHIRLAQVLLPCRDLAATLAFFTDRLGFKVNLIFPAVSPSNAVITGHGLALRLEAGEATDWAWTYPLWVVL